MVYEQEINIKQTSDENNIIYQLNEPMKKIELKTKKEKSTERRTI